jgi:hypothetical protein
MVFWYYADKMNTGYFRNAFELPRGRRETLMLLAQIQPKPAASFQLNRKLKSRDLWHLLCVSVPIVSSFLFCYTVCAIILLIICLRFNNNGMNYQYTSLLAGGTKRLFIKLSAHVCGPLGLLCPWSQRIFSQAYDSRYKHPVAFYCRD